MTNSACDRQHFRELVFLFQPATSGNFKQTVSGLKYFGLPISKEITFIKNTEASCRLEVNFYLRKLFIEFINRCNNNTQARDTQGQLTNII